MAGTIGACCCGTGKSKPWIFWASLWMTCRSPSSSVDILTGCRLTFVFHLHHVHQIVPDDLPVVAEAYDSGRLTQRHWDEIHDIDYLVAGLPFGPGPKDEVVMGIQVALRVDAGTVEDIARRVACFAACGAKVIAAVDGRYINPDAEQRAVELGVTVRVRKVQPAA